MSTVVRLQAWLGLVRRYRQAFAHAWSQRDKIGMPDFKPNEAEFLPAALSLQASPVSPVGRWVARLLMLMVSIALAWSIFGRIDIIVDAHGRVVPSSRTKTISSMEIGVVRALHVTDGQAVKAGDHLVELDTRVSDSERDKAVGDEESAQLQALRSRALLASLDNGTPPRLRSAGDIPQARVADAQRQLDDQWRDYQAKRMRLDQDIARYADALPLASQRAKDYEALAVSHDVSQHAWSEKEQARIDLEGQLRDARAEQVSLAAETRKSAEDALYEAERSLGDAAQDARRARVHSELLTLDSPVDGTVQDLSIHTVGAAVPAAQPLMQIVPRDGPIEIEAMLDNKDVGFVVEGQPAQVKIDAFSYSKYGTVPAHVAHVSRDAVQDDKKNWLYAVTIVLDRATLVVEGKDVRVTPGMTASIDIRTGDRRVIEYVLSPLVEHAKESLRER